MVYDWVLAFDLTHDSTYDYWWLLTVTLTDGFNFINPQHNDMSWVQPATIPGMRQLSIADDQLWATDMSIPLGSR